MTSYGFNQNFNVGSFGSGGGGGFGGGFSYASSPPYQDGIKRDYYSTGYYNDDPYWFNYETPTDTTYPTDVIADPADIFDPPNNYSIRWTGYFKAPTTETYTFYLTSDDASHMWIGPSAKVGWSIDNVFINNGGLHGGQEVSNTISLVAGNYYPIQVLFGEYGGGSILTFSYSTDTIPKTTDLTGLIYYSQNLDPFLRGIENKSPVTLITSGSITINGNVFSWPTFDAAGPDPAGWNTLLAQAYPLQKIYSISGAGSLGGPSIDLLNFVGRGDLPAGSPLVCEGYVSETGSLGVGDYGIRAESLLGTAGMPIHSFTEYLSGNTHFPGGSPPFEWASTYFGDAPENGITFTAINPVDSDEPGTGDAPAVFLVFVTPPPPVGVVQDHLELWFDSRYTGSYSGTGTSWTDMKNGIVATMGSGVTFDSLSGTMVFDGSGGAYASTPSYASDLSTGYTLEAYVRWDSLPSYDGVIAYNDPPRYANVEYYSPGVRFEGAGAQIKDLTTSPDLGVFYHYVATWDGSYIRLYRDGTLIASGSATQVQSAVHTAQWIMGQWDGNLNGAITMTRLYSKALSPAEILQNYNATLNPDVPPPSVPVPDPYFKWDPANYNSGDQTVPDTGTYPYNNKLFLQNGVTVVSGPPAKMTFGGDGTTQDGYTVTAMSPGPFTFTISAWVKTPWTARKLIGFESNQVGEGSSLFDRHMFIQDSTGLLGFGVYDTQQEVVLSTTPVNDSGWHHCVATCEFDPNTQDPGTGTLKLYVDGVLEGTKAASPLNYGGYWRIASYAGWSPYFYNGYYNGSLGIVEIYNEALTDAQVAQLWTNEKTTYGL